MLDTEISGLRKLICNAESFCNRHGYGSSEANSLIEVRCRKYVDILIPVVAVTPEAYEAVIKERPSLGLYLSEKINHYFATLPSEIEIEKDLVGTLRDTQKLSFQGEKFNLGHFASVEIMVNKYGFSQGLMRAIHKVKPELSTMVLRLYDMRLTSLQQIEEMATGPEDR